MKEKLGNPRVLVVALGRINARDTSNNGLLLRNILGRALPRENLAQIYSSGDNGDTGSFGHYYQMKDGDRTFGSLFYKLKGNVLSTESENISYDTSNFFRRLIGKLKHNLHRVLIDTGIYELLFRPRLSKEMLNWIIEFKPDIIFAQGYNLTFTWLPVLIKNATGAQLAFLTTDDWPMSLYSGQHGEPKLFCWLVRPIVESAARRLISEVDIPFAFGQPMSDEYFKRYRKNFITLNHADSQIRFENAVAHRVHSNEVKTIVAIGTFNHFRWPLLLDVNNACQLLQERGINVRLLVLTNSIESDGRKALAEASYVDILADPGNENLPSYLKGADILLLAEGFDEDFVSAIKFSVSSKAHLFMFSRRPIIVYSHSKTGVACYAQSFQWARLVSSRIIEDLADAIQNLIQDENYVENLVVRADEVASKFHSHSLNCEILLKSFQGVKS